jgi:hypothetical protein
MTKRYKATRSLHYVAEDGTDRLVAEGDWVTDLSEGQVAELLADEIIRESRAKE